MTAGLLDTIELGDTVRYAGSEWRVQDLHEHGPLGQPQATLVAADGFTGKPRVPVMNLLLVKKGGRS